MPSQEQDLHRSFVSYLTRTGWVTTSHGVAGDLWVNDRFFQSGVLAVPRIGRITAHEFRGAVDRIARAEDREVEAVLRDLEGEFLDVQSYRISDQYVYDDAALLDGVGTILASARALIRAAATTARKARARIGGNYSKLGDEVASRARLSHTRRGSFVLPIVMPVEPSAPATDQLGSESFTIESSERQVTRTVALAVQALETVVVRESREPSADAVMHLVESGVSREVVSAVRAIATAPGVATFSAAFSWSPAVGAPAGVPATVVIPVDAAPLLGRIEERLSAARVGDDAAVSGQIVQITYVPDEPFGSFAIRTERRGRPANVLVHVRESVIHEAYEWARDQRAVLVRGRIDTAPGKALGISSPSRVVPIDQLFTEIGDQLAPPG